MLEFEGGYISPLFLTGAGQETVELDRPYILVHQEPISKHEPMLPLLEEIQATGRPMLFVGGGVTDWLLNMLVRNMRLGGLRVVAVRVPQLDAQYNSVLDDIAAFTGTYVVNQDLGVLAEHMTLDMLGGAQQVIVHKSKTVMVGGAGIKLAASDAEHERPDRVGGRLAIPNRPGAGGKKLAAAADAMVAAVQENRISYGELRRLKQKELQQLHPDAGRTTLTAARERALARLAAMGFSDSPAT
jgi:chaperonin GroEL (HSP60 family)